MDDSAGLPASRRITGTLLLVGFAAFNLSLIESISPDWNVPVVTHHFVFLIEALVLCVLAKHFAVFGIGDVERWRRFGLSIAILFAIPPLMVISVYATMTSKPFAGIRWDNWLVSSAAQELFFAGFIYGCLARLHGEPSIEARSTFHQVLLLTALSFMAWHWPNARYFSHEYMVFQFAYTFLGGILTLQMRRWTGSLWPGVANHILVNYLAATL
jgi:hypothetical protein